MAKATKATEDKATKATKATTKATDKTTVEDKAMTEAQAKKQREKEIRDKNNAEMKAAKAVLKSFKETSEYLALPQDVQEAITRVIGKAAFGGGIARQDTFADKLAEMFPEVGATVSELDIFKEYKMGVSEFRKRVREALKKAQPEDRLWIEHDKDAEEWRLLAKGVAQPEGFLGKPIA